MAKKSRRPSPQRQAAKEAYTKADLDQARTYTLVLGFVALVGLAYDGWCVGHAHAAHEHFLVPLQIIVLPFAALIIFAISLWSWLAIRKSLRKAKGKDEQQT